MSTLNYSNVAFSFAAQRTGTGGANATVQYSLNGSSFTNLGIIVPGASSPGFTGQGVKAHVKANICRFNERNILNMKKREHGTSPHSGKQTASPLFQHFMDFTAKVGGGFIGAHNKDYSIIPS